MRSKIVSLPVILSLTAIISCSAVSYAQSCGEQRESIIRDYKRGCGPDFCDNRSKATICYSYHDLRFERYDSGSAHGFRVYCPYTATYNDGNGQQSSLGEYYINSIEDCPNSPQQPPPPPPQSPNSSNSGPPGGCPLKGSIVNAEAQTLGEEVPLVGSNFSLVYNSAYQDGHIIDFKLIYRITGSTPSDFAETYYLKNFRNNVVIDSGAFSATEANQTYMYLWNGLDVNNTTKIMSERFKLTVSETAPSYNISYDYNVRLSHFDAKAMGFGGWLPTNLRRYDTNINRVYYANGDSADVDAKPFGNTQVYVADPSGREVYIFDNQGRHLYTKTGLLGTTIYTFNYDSAGRLSSIQEPFGRITVFNRNSNGELTSIVAPKGQVTNISLDANGYISSITNPKSESYMMTYYSNNGLLHTFKKPNSDVSSFDYDADGLLIKDSHSGGYFFDLVRNLNGQLSYEMMQTTAMGRVTSIRTEVGEGYISRSVTSSTGAASSTNYLPNGSDTTREDSGQNYYVGIQSHDDQRFGKMVRFPFAKTYTVGGGGMRNVSSSQYIKLSDNTDPFSITTWVETHQLDNANTKSTVSFNPSTKTFSEETFLGRTREWAIDSLERPVTFKVGNTTPIAFGYTNENLTSIVHGSRAVNFTYNSSGLLASIVNPLSQATSYVYDSAERLRTKILPDNRYITYAYDGVGNITGITPPGRPIHSFATNGHGLIGAYQPPTLSGVSTVNTTYTYNLDKQLTRITRPSGEHIDFNYDQQTSLLEGYNTPQGSYQYAEYAETGLPSSIQTPSNVQIYLQYAGAVLSGTSTSSNGDTVGSFAAKYGDQNHIESDTVTGVDASVSSVVSYSYNDDEDLAIAGDIHLAYNTPNGQLIGTSVGTGDAAITDSYTYNNFGEVTGYQAKRGATVIYDLALTRDGAGRINGKTQWMNNASNVFSYSFDVTGRLVQTSKNSNITANYGYDENSNRIAGNVGVQPTHATYDDQDRLLSYNAWAFTYNANGDLQTKTNTITNTTTKYTYDVFGNLTKVELPGGPEIEYEIDGLNRRIGKKINGVIQKRWVYMDQYRIAAELNGDGEITKRFVYGSKGNIPDYMIIKGVNYRIISDHLGSPRLVVKMSDGSITQRMDHDEFGRVTENTNPDVLPFGFAGGIYDQHTGIVRFGARDYDPEVGRWTSKDPILFNGADANLYGYTWNDPINGIDPQGLLTLQLGIAFNFHFGGFNAQGGFGVAVDSHGGIGGYSYEGGGVGAGATSGFGGSIQASNADNICDLRGKFANSSAHGGAGLGGALDVFSGHALNGSEINGAGITFGAQEGGSFSTGLTDTQITPWRVR